MSDELFAGIDLGTSGIKIVIADSQDNIHASASRSVETLRLQDGWNEQHPDTWWNATCECFDELSHHKDIMARVRGIGFSGQMLGPVLIDKNDNPVREVLLWNDCRATDECRELQQLVPDIGIRTNGTPDPGLGAPKLRWLKKHEPGVLDKADCLLLPKDYVRLKLTGTRLTEPSDAGGTMLMECADSRWSQQLCEAAHWQMEHLPPVVNSWDKAGEVSDSLCSRFGIPKNTPVAAGAGDNMACSLGVGVAVPGDCAITIGTSGVICTVTESFKPLPDVAFLTSLHAAPGCYLSMGVVMSATASFEWLAKLTGRDSRLLSNEIDQLYRSGAAFQSPVTAPWFNGNRSPYNNSQARGIIRGVGLTTDAAMLGWSIFEGVAFQFAECQLAQRQAGIEATDVTLVGGGANSELWCSIIATALDTTVTLPAGRQFAACLGASRLAQVAAGYGGTEILTRKPGTDKRIHPDNNMQDALGERFQTYLQLARDELSIANA